MDFKSLIKNCREESDSLTINLMLTMTCTFECAHCFYGCKKSTHHTYMSDEMLWHVREALVRLHEYGIEHLDLNLIGGEPTADLYKFQHVLETIEDIFESLDFNVDIQMTTNGWWLENPDTARQFFTIIDKSKLFHNQFANYGEAMIRISDDEYHLEFRDRTKRMSAFFEDLKETNLWDQESCLCVEEICVCAECREERVDDGEPCKCGCEDTDFEYGEEFFDPDVYKLFYIEQWLEGTKYVIPSGTRGKFGQNEVCSQDPALTFDVSGHLTDGCCRGSKMPFGNILNDPAYLLAMVTTFMSEPRNCRTCREQARHWATEKRKEAARLMVEQEERHLEESEQEVV